MSVRTVQPQQTARLVLNIHLLTKILPQVLRLVFTSMRQLAAPLKNKHDLGYNLLPILILIPLNRLQLNLPIKSLKLIHLQHILKLNQLGHPLFFLLKIDRLVIDFAIINLLVQKFLGDI